MDHFGVKSPMKVEEIKDKCRQNTINSCKDKFGETNILNLQSHKQEITLQIIDTYGENYIEFIDKIEEVSKKEKYGLEWKFIVLKNINKAYSPEAQKKCHDTRKKNNTFKSSKLEPLFEQYLTEKFGIDNFESQYRSELYPYNCDFYIKPLNLYIEIQGTWTHGSKPFEGTDEDLALVEYWKSKNTPYYNNAITNWTISDVDKRNVAKENNLNYLEIFANDINTIIKIFEEYINANYTQDVKNLFL